MQHIEAEIEFSESVGYTRGDRVRAARVKKLLEFQPLLNRIAEVDYIVGAPKCGTSGRLIHARGELQITPSLTGGVRSRYASISVQDRIKHHIPLTHIKSLKVYSPRV